jgi:ribosomal protein S18 acetylase RimI-like enzyme
MIIIRKLETIDMDSLKQLIRGYVSSEKYQVLREESEVKVSFTLELIKLQTPYIKHYELDSLEEYQSIVSLGFSLAAYIDEQLVALSLARPQDWNGSLWIHEFHVLEAYQGKGIGRQLMEATGQKARDAQIRILFCETQNTNVPAIRFYRRMGFSIDAIDLSLYSNEDYPDGEIALFMKRRLDKVK